MLRSYWLVAITCKDPLAAKFLLKHSALAIFHPLSELPAHQPLYVQIA